MRYVDQIFREFLLTRQRRDVEYAPGSKGLMGRSLYRATEGQRDGWRFPPGATVSALPFFLPIGVLHVDAQKVGGSEPTAIKIGC
jgi:hypothetical protein